MLLQYHFGKSEALLVSNSYRLYRSTTYASSYFILQTTSSSAQATLTRLSYSEASWPEISHG